MVTCCSCIASRRAARVLAGARLISSPSFLSVIGNGRPGWRCNDLRPQGPLWDSAGKPAATH
jgi:hypothetical protein